MKDIIFMCKLLHKTVLKLYKVKIAFVEFELILYYTKDLNCL